MAQRLKIEQKGFFEEEKKQNKSCLSFFVKHPVYLHIEELYTHNSNPTYFLDNSFSFIVFQIKCNAKKNSLI